MLSENEMNYRNVDDLIDQIKSAKTIGIDGVDGSGKTSLSKEVGKKLNLSVLNLDDYLIKNKENYVENLKYNEIHEFIEKHQNCFIIEGVCLLNILKKLNLNLDCLIYVKRINKRDEWLDEEECDIKGSAEEIIKRIEEKIKIINPNSQGLTAFRKEVINYHAIEKPLSKANYFFESIKND